MCPSRGNNQPNTNGEIRNKRQAAIGPAGGGSQGPGQFEGGPTPDVVKNEYEFLKLYMELNESVRLKIGHQFDMIKSCTFQGSDCLDKRCITRLLKL